ncbi:MAG: hypothetical protein HQ582_11470 [Planctomycetes bacterium]|nr:hypothetical protein [Planctomycetota bacterium]
MYGGRLVIAICGLIAVACFSWTASARAEMRVWKDRTGKFSTQAEFVAVSSDSVELKKPDGTLVRVPLRLLSKQDLRFLETLRRSATDAGGAGQAAKGAIADKPKLSRLSRPSKHWAHELPPSQQTKSVRIAIRVTDEAGGPLGAIVLAICQPWGFRQHLATDANAELNLNGPVGDWTFYVCAGPRLFSVSRAKVTSDIAQTLKMPARPAQIALVDGRGSGLLTQLRMRKFRPGEERCFPSLWLAPMSAPGAPPMLSGGGYPSGTLPHSISVDVAEDCIVGLVAAPRQGEKGCALFGRCRPVGRRSLSVNERRLATVAISVGDNWPDMSLEVVGLDQEEIPVYLYVPLLKAGDYEILVPPGTSRFGLRSQHGTFVPVIRTLAPGGRTELAYGGPFRASPEILRCEPGLLKVWFDIKDSLGNYLSWSPGSAHLTLKSGGVKVFDDEVTDAGGRSADVTPAWGEGWEGKPLDYDYRLDSELTGPVVSRGQFTPQDTIDKKSHRVHQTPFFEVFARERTDSGVRLAEALEKVHAAMASAVAGPVRPSHGGRFRIRFASPFGLAWSSGDVIALDIYSSHWFWPTSCGEAVPVITHEFGHSYWGRLGNPQNLSSWGVDAVEGAGNWFSGQALRKAFDERAYQSVRMDHNTDLLSSPVGKSVHGITFIVDYVDQRFGAAVNGEMFWRLYAGKGDLRKQIEQDPDLTTEHERLAVLHSKLTSQNLAWLYRWAHFSVSDDTVDRALVRLRDTQRPNTANSRDIPEKPSRKSSTNR